jgi:hypothetical protein
MSCGDQGFFYSEDDDYDGDNFMDDESWEG